MSDEAYCLLCENSHDGCLIAILDIPARERAKSSGDTASFGVLLCVQRVRHSLFLCQGPRPGIFRESDIGADKAW